MGWKDPGRLFRHSSTWSFNDFHSVKLTVRVSSPRHMLITLPSSRLIRLDQSSSSAGGGIQTFDRSIFKGRFSIRATVMCSRR